MVANMLDGIEVCLDKDYFENKKKLDALADKIVYTGRLMLTLNTNWELWSIVLYALRRKCWTNRIFREMRR